ncbi:hypothetical protein A3H75_00320 [Candidatus Uhrbacteria bacterium RIFCSPLOWO2_02_FULL_51_9]|uniref:Type II toxin-antitoxin system HicA family toxin n=1 Tax=Candidatus Uhrbacteria bacterium RIFCSPLOWO2_02_FULL_51_9 TaxID=1802410 RepID=A0A1F7VFA1_9BACT|nr:MAG: hypothetical protein A3H75_00320 [Candidatus Uhrbacteria bacterium RIFCSPLOWO2_02_FULL_51_9]
MGEYADVKRDRVLVLLKWLGTLNGFEVINGGKHQWVVRHGTWNRPFPVTFKYNVVSKVYIKELVKRVVATGACSKEEFDEHL